MALNKEEYKMNARSTRVLLISLSVLLLAACTPTEVVKSVVVTQEVQVAGTPVVQQVVVVATPAPYSPTGQEDQVVPPIDANRMVIKDAQLELLVSDTDIALTQVTQMAADYGGYIISSESWYKESYKYATLRLGIPSSSFELALNFLRHMGVQVLSENASGQDVTAEYVDLQSRLANLQATAARVRTFLDEARTVEQAILVNQQLSELEGEIEQIEGQMRYYEGRSTYSTITVSLTPEMPTPTPTLTPTPTPTLTPIPGWNPGNTFDQASHVLKNMTQSTVDLLIWLLVLVAPALVIIGLLYWGGRTVYRRLRRH
jgi:hypothetical protein